MQKIGVFFTPIKVWKWVIKKNNLLDKLVQGKTFFDPTGGEGNFILAFIELLKENKLSLSYIKNLYFNEVQKEFIDTFNEKTKNKFPKQNIFNIDFITNKIYQKFDYILGNPPWANFTNLTEKYKNIIKPYFLYYDCIKSKNLLLGSARIDIASLITQIVIRRNLIENGEAFLFLPSSIFHNTGAHDYFREYKYFSLDYIYNFDKKPIWNDISTNYVLAHFTKNKKQEYPIPYFEYENKWIQKSANPIDKYGPLFISDNKIEKIKCPIISKPRQGVNTCGANDIYIFDDIKIKNNICLLKNKKQVIKVEYDLVYPLITKNQFEDKEIHKHIILPYKNGKILSFEELNNYPLTRDYLFSYKEFLTNRKGTMIQSFTKNFFYAILGIGNYTFMPYKIVWQSYGKSKFIPKVFTSINNKVWIPNQALHTFMPFTNKEIAKRIYKELKNPEIEKYLLSFKSEGTCNWAQPSRLLPILSLGA